MACMVIPRSSFYIFWNSVILLLRMSFVNDCVAQRSCKAGHSGHLPAPQAFLGLSHHPPPPRLYHSLNSNPDPICKCILRPQPSLPHPQLTSSESPFGQLPFPSWAPCPPSCVLALGRQIYGHKPWEGLGRVCCGAGLLHCFPGMGYLRLCICPLTRTLDIPLSSQGWELLAPCSPQATEGQG